MILRSANRYYEQVKKLEPENNTQHGLWKIREEGACQVVHMVQIAKQDLYRDSIPLIQELEENNAFTDLIELFFADDILCMVFTWLEGISLSEYLKDQTLSMEQRFETGRKILERALVLNIPVFLLTEVLNEKRLIIPFQESSDSVIGFYYAFSDTKKIPDVDSQELSECVCSLLSCLFEVEDKTGLYPELKKLFEEIRSEKEPELIKLYQQYLMLSPIVNEIRTPPEKVKKEPLGDKLKKKTVVFLTVFKIAAGLTVLAASSVMLFKTWNEKIFPIVESAYLVKTFQNADEKKDSYTGKVEIVSGDEETILFRGRLEDGKRMGFGTEYYRMGSVLYEGDFSGNLYSGQGSLFGQNGKLLYQGSFLTGAYDGLGTLYDNTGAIAYKGEFVQGKKEGSGSLYDRRGNLTYEGAFKNNLYDGNGVLYEDGQPVYEGVFSGGKPNGAGLLYENGILKEKGIFEKGVFLEGEGVLYDEEGNKLYEGGIKDGKAEGEGVAYENNAIVYEGSFKKGVYEGEGKLYIPENKVLVYQGSFLNGSYNGKGCLYDAYSHMPIYNGTFRMGYYDGEGLEYDISGNLRYQGSFLMGKYNGYGILYNPATGMTEQEGEFRNGLLVTPKEELLKDEESGEDDTLPDNIAANAEIQIPVNASDVKTGPAAEEATEADRQDGPAGMKNQEGEPDYGRETDSLVAEEKR